MTQGFKEELFGPTFSRQSPNEIFEGKRQGFMEENEPIYSSKGHSLQDLVKLLAKEESEIELFLKNDGQESQENEGQNSNKSRKSDLSPLFLATISNIPEIVEEIFVQCPHTLGHTNNEGMNILQVAILYRRTELFDILVKSPLLPRNLLSATDNGGNSLLHMVGKKMPSQASERMESPAFQLRKELLFFEKVKSACKMHLTRRLNNNYKTAEELFAASNEELHQRAKEWLMRTTENCTILVLTVFIATVAFAAPYTVPGGPDQDAGILNLPSKPFFNVFIIADVISLTLALISMGIFLEILTSSFPLQDFKTYLLKKLIQGIICLVLSVSMMAVAFGAAITLVMEHNRKNVVWQVVAFLPVPIFFLSYSPLHLAVLRLCSEQFRIPVVKFFFEVLCFPLYAAFKGLRWTVKKACEFITCKSPGSTTAGHFTQV